MYDENSPVLTIRMATAAETRLLGKLVGVPDVIKFFIGLDDMGYGGSTIGFFAINPETGTKDYGIFNNESIGFCSFSEMLAAIASSTCD